MSMEGIFEEIGRTIAGKGRAAAEKAKEFTELVQLKTQLAAEKSRIRELYAALGKWYYEKEQGIFQEENIRPEAELSHGIGILRARMEKLEEEIARMEEAGNCPGCGVKVPKDSSFCPNCGARIRGEQETEEPGPADMPILPRLENHETAEADEESFFQE